MKRFAGPIALVLGLAVVGQLAAAGEGGREEYVCPPCDCGQDAQVHRAAGRCSACGMELIRKEEVQSVSILLFDGVQIIDYTGPYEVFGQAGFGVSTVSRTGRPIKTAMGMTVTPDHSFATSPQSTILVVPGGGVDVATGDPNVIAWVQARAVRASHVMSVCNGAFILARAGLLDGLSATTFFGLLDELRRAAPGVRVVSDQRFVDNGKIITAAGLSSGIDTALHLVSKIRGRGEAERLALHLEYDWKPDAGFARGALAERHLPRLREPEGASVQLLATRGDRDRWEARYRVRLETSAAALMQHISGQLEKLPGWSRAGGGGQAGETRATWRFADGQGASWANTVVVESDPAAASTFIVSMVLARGGRGGRGGRGTSP